MFKTRLKYLLFFAVAFIFCNACKKKNTPPTLTLLGEEVIELCIGDSFIDPGVGSIDAYEEDISGNIEIISNLNNELVGSYTVTYSSTDNNGNVSTINRTVNVDVCVSTLLSSYNVNHDCQINLGFMAIDLIASDQSIVEGNSSNEIIIQDFNQFIPEVVANLDGVNVIIPENTFSVGQAPLQISLTISGSGTVNDSGDEIVIDYAWDAGIIGSDTCIATYNK
jgi:hypothetical protein